MRHKIYFLLLFFTLATAGTVSAQTCPGPAVRTALINLQKSNIVNGTRWGQTVLTDTCGNQRYVTLDSLIYIITDSIAADTALQWNWYTQNDTTTNLLRTASVLRSALWRTIDSLGFLRFQNRPDGFDGPQFTLWQDSIVVDADTVVWRSNYNQPLQYHDFTADGTYLHQDSLKVGAWGQFPGFPSLISDGTEKGVLLDPLNEGIIITNGDPSVNVISKIVTYPDGVSVSASNNFTSSTAKTNAFINSSESGVTETAFFPSGVSLTLELYSSDLSNSNFFEMYHNPVDTNIYAAVILGDKQDHERRQFEVYTIPSIVYSWFQIFLPNDTTENALSFYNRAYYFPNARPSNTLGDTSVIAWIGDGTNAGKHPEFVPFPSGGSGTNWYNSNGTTTDNSRIADVLETATWRSDNVTEDGIVPFRFELAGVGANEPENMVWLFPNGDSAMIRQRDSEIELFTNSAWVLKADLAATVQADSFTFNPNLGGNAFRVGRYNVVTQNSDASSNVTHRDAVEYNSITGTGQTEIFLDGSSAVWVIPTNSNQNFKINVSAICSAAGNGVGISTGDAWDSWHLGGIKRVGATTALVGSVQTPATAQSDASMSTSVVTIDADDGDDSLRIRFTPPSTAGTTTVIQVSASIEIIQTSY